MPGSPSFATLLSETFEPEQFGPASFLGGRFATILEYGPRLNFETAWSSNAVEICHRSGVRSVSGAWSGRCGWG